MTRQTLTVTKFNSIIRDIFNAEELLHNIQIVGEVFGMSYSKTATYFSIKDDESSLPCVCFNTEILKDVEEGSSCVFTGSPNFYAKSGRFNFVVSKVEPYGQGALYQNFLLLKEKLSKEGLFDAEHKKTMPLSIKRIGVVTSKEGAVLQDIKNVTWRRNKAIDIVLYDTKVQGKDAEKEIANGINFFSAYPNVDVVIVARGGGSMEDLSAYNTELVARATYACQKPIVSAVGHETDFTIIDFVSDLRAPTPSAAAELLTRDNQVQLMGFKREVSRLSRLLESYVSEKNFAFDRDKKNLLFLAENFVREKQLKLEKIREFLSSKINAFVLEKEYSLNLKLATLKKLNPLDILALGYAKIEQNGKVINQLSSVNLNENVEINFVDGKLTTKPVRSEK